MVWFKNQLLFFLILCTKFSLTTQIKLPALVIEDKVLHGKQFQNPIYSTRKTCQFPHSELMIDPKKPMWIFNIFT